MDGQAGIRRCNVVHCCSASLAHRALLPAVSVLPIVLMTFAEVEAADQYADLCSQSPFESHLLKPVT